MPLRPAGISGIDVPERHGLNSLICAPCMHARFKPDPQSMRRALAAANRPPEVRESGLAR
jgi:hypothetical protein